MKKALFTLFSVGTLLFNSYALSNKILYKNLIPKKYFKNYQEFKNFEKNESNKIKQTLEDKLKNLKLSKKQKETTKELLNLGVISWYFDKTRFTEFNTEEYAKQTNNKKPYFKKITYLTYPNKVIILGTLPERKINLKTGKINELSYKESTKYILIAYHYKKNLNKKIMFSNPKEIEKIISKEYTDKKIKKLYQLYLGHGKPDLVNKIKLRNQIIKEYSKLDEKYYDKAKELSKKVSPQEYLKQLKIWNSK